MKTKKILIIFIILILISNMFTVSIFAVQSKDIKQTKENKIFYDDFSSNKLDTSKWLISEKVWGLNNGGVVSDNVSISDGILKLEGHGDYYTGDIHGINKTDGKRTGAAIATKEYYGSGSYEIVAKVAPELGACSAIWTFEYEEYYPGDEKYEELAPNGASYYAVNHEIDIEMPGRPSQNSENISYEYALCNTWVGEREGEYTTGYTKLPKAQNDGEFHTYRFDWHTGDKNETPRVEFYIDGQLVNTNTTHIPTNKGRLWIGLWFPNGWAGKPDFDTTVFEIDSVKITPFNEAGDTEPNETYANDGWHIENTLTAYEAINEMKIGWNLGNTLDSCDYKKQYLGEEKAVPYYETLWANPVTTKELIDSIKAAGFNSIRVPVTYYDHINENGEINELWLNRVEEVVGYVLENNMYCILDVHHDSGLCEIGSWIRTDANEYDENAKNLAFLWKQIANRFKDYDYKLIFEGFNEIVDTNKNYDWVTGYDNTINVNKLNQVFVDTVRSTGGKNVDRFLAVSTFGAITDEQKLSTFVMPEDTAKNKIILALHDYSSNENDILKMYERIEKYCITKNIPVILDEFGTKSTSMTEEQRAESASNYINKAKELGIACFWWDDGGNYMLYNRKNKSWEYEKIKYAITSPYIEEAAEEPLSFRLALNSNKDSLKLGDTVTVTTSISEIQKNASNGLIAICGNIEYDENVLELDLDSIEGLASWNMSKEYFNEQNGKFVLDADKYIDKVEQVFKMTFKVKENAKVSESTIKLTSITGATGKNMNGIIKTEDTQITINIAQKQEDNITSKKYSIDNKKIYNILPDTKVSEFKANVEAIGDLIFTDINGKILTDNDFIKTGTKLKVGTTLNYELVVIGDVDGDGRITINDVAKIKLHYIDLSPLIGIYIQAADVDNDSKTTVNDLAIIKLICIGEIKIR